MFVDEIGEVIDLIGGGTTEGIRGTLKKTSISESNNKISYEGNILNVPEGDRLTNRSSNNKHVIVVLAER